MKPFLYGDHDRYGGAAMLPASSPSVRNQFRPPRNSNPNGAPTDQSLLFSRVGRYRGSNYARIRASCYCRPVVFRRRLTLKEYRREGGGGTTEAAGSSPTHPICSDTGTTDRYCYSTRPSSQKTSRRCTSSQEVQKYVFMKVLPLAVAISIVQSVIAQTQIDLVFVVDGSGR